MMRQDNTPIKQDGISLFFFVFSTTELAFLFLQGEGFTAPLAFGTVVALFLAILGVVGAFIFHTSGQAGVLTSKAALNVGVGFIVALTGFILFNAFIPELQTVSASVVGVKTFFGTFNLSITTLEEQLAAVLFAVILIPTAEENFFRGFLANLSISKAGPGVGLLLQAFFFMVFHMPAYGYAVVTLAIIFMDGLIIGAVDLQTGRLSTGLLAHIANNALSYVVITGAIILPAPLVLSGVPLTQFITPAVLGAVFLWNLRAKARAR